MARGNKENKKWEPLFTIEYGDNYKAQGTYANKDDEGAFYGYINLIVCDLISIKCAVMEGKKGAFLSLPHNRSGKEYYNQVVPMSKEVAADFNEIAKLCAKEFDAL